MCTSLIIHTIIIKYIAIIYLLLLNRTLTLAIGQNQEMMEYFMQHNQVRLLLNTQQLLQHQYLLLHIQQLLNHQMKINSGTIIMVIQYHSQQLLISNHIQIKRINRVGMLLMLHTALNHLKSIIQIKEAKRRSQYRVTKQIQYNLLHIQQLLIHLLLHHLLILLNKINHSLSKLLQIRILCLTRHLITHFPLLHINILLIMDRISHIDYYYED